MVFAFQLLQKDRTKRLGALHDFDEIRHDAFFSSIDWCALEARKLTPPFNPGVVRTICSVIYLAYHKFLG